jgi:hypothetical protein
MAWTISMAKARAERVVVDLILDRESWWRVDAMLWDLQDGVDESTARS